MAKIAIELGLPQIETLIKQLKPRQRVLLAQRLKTEQGWAEEFDTLVKEIRKQAHKNKVSDQKIIRMVEEARRQVYGN